MQTQTMYIFNEERSCIMLLRLAANRGSNLPSPSERRLLRSPLIRRTVHFPRAEEIEGNH